MTDSMTVILPKREDCSTCIDGEYYSHAYIKCKKTGELHGWRYCCNDYCRLGHSREETKLRKNKDE